MPQYPYYPVSGPKLISWPKLILLGLGLLVLAVIIIFFILDPLHVITKEANNLFKGNDSTNNNSQDVVINLYDCSADVYNCANFSSQTEAQAAYDYCMEQGVGDVHNLDNDGDGIVCESLSS